MTIDEAIKYEEWASETSTGDVAREHGQYALWLKTLQLVVETNVVYAHILEIEEVSERLRSTLRDMSKAFLTLDVDHCQACPRDMACTFIHKSFDTRECAFERDMLELGIEV